MDGNKLEELRELVEFLKASGIAEFDMEQDDLKVRIKFAGCGSGDNKFIVKDYAWGDPGDQIKAGQTQLQEDEAQVAPQAAKKPDAAPVSDSQGSLGLLALGAVGLQAWRKSRRSVNSDTP